jgi:hypothetical protein
VKKLLFISPRNPFSGRFSGDVIRAKKFIGFFEKKYKTTVITIDKVDSNKKIGKVKIISFKDKNLIFKLIKVIFSLLNLKPLQLGYFYSKELNDYILQNYKNFDIIFCQSVRAAQYVTNLEFKKKVLDMGDLYSNNYYQTFKMKSWFNPMKIIFFIESILMKNYEKLCFDNFFKILLFSRREIKSVKAVKKNKIIQINFGIDEIINKFRFNKNNNKIIFIGNMKYLPNKIACTNFIKNTLPKLLKVNSNIQFHIIGEISKLNKFLWEKNKSIQTHGKVKNLKPLLANTICGLANLNISSGIQTKLLSYMSYGIPSISSNQVIKNFDAIKSNSLPAYRNEKELIKLILRLKNKKTYSLSISKKSLNLIRKFKWKNVLKDLNKI